jgi:cell division protease FtsH
MAEKSVLTFLLLQVLGSVPRILEQQAAELDQQDKQQSATAEGSSEQPAAAQQGEQPSQQQQQPMGDSLQASLEAKGVPSELAAAVDAALKLDDDTLASVSRAIMGRLDIVDLVGKNTAYEVAERVSHHLFLSSNYLAAV